MNIYEVKEIDCSNIKTVDDFELIYNNTKPLYIEGLKNVENHIGVKLKRERAGYAAYNGNIYYIAVRTK